MVEKKLRLFFDIKFRMLLDIRLRMLLDIKLRMLLDIKLRMLFDIKLRFFSELKVRGNEGRVVLLRFVCKNLVVCVSERGYLYIFEGVW